MNLKKQVEGLQPIEVPPDLEFEKGPCRIHGHLSSVITPTTDS